MATFRELSAPYENFLLRPQPGPGVCARCFNLTDEGYRYCYACTRQEAVLDAMAPISYSVAREQLHHALATYKRWIGPAARRLSVQLAAVLWRYLGAHEPCLARAAGVDNFPIVTTIPPGQSAREREHPLRWMVGEVIEVTRDRYQGLLRRSSLEVAPRSFHPGKYASEASLSGEPVLLIDDTWTTGSTAQSAAATLKAAGAGAVAAVVIGRHINRDWHANDRRLRALPRFDWDQCALCRPVPEEATPA
jgi:predicted amidophosphoribosyltransferase